MTGDRRAPDVVRARLAREAPGPGATEFEDPGAPALVVRVVTGGTTRAGLYMLVHRVDVGGPEVEGGAATLTEDERPFAAYHAGPAAAVSGDLLVARFLGRRWVTEKGGTPCDYLVNVAVGLCPSSVPPGDVTVTRTSDGWTGSCTPATTGLLSGRCSVAVPGPGDYTASGPGYGGTVSAPVTVKSCGVTQVNLGECCMRVALVGCAALLMPDGSYTPISGPVAGGQVTATRVSTGASTTLTVPDANPVTFHDLACGEQYRFTATGTNYATKSATIYTNQGGSTTGLPGGPPLTFVLSPAPGYSCLPDICCPASAQTGAPYPVPDYTSRTILLNDGFGVIPLGYGPTTYVPPLMNAGPIRAWSGSAGRLSQYAWVNNPPCGAPPLTNTDVPVYFLMWCQPNRGGSLAGWNVLVFVLASCCHSTDPYSTLSSSYKAPAIGPALSGPLPPGIQCVSAGGFAGGVVPALLIAGGTATPTGCPPSMTWDVAVTDYDPPNVDLNPAGSPFSWVYGSAAGAGAWTAMMV